VVVPQARLTAKQVEDDYDIRLNSCTDGRRLGQEIAEFVQFCSAAGASESVSDFKGVASRWLSGLHRLLSHVDSLAQIAAIDGCTVFNADLQLLGFGGRIDVLDAPKAKQAVNASSGDVLNRDEIARTEHDTFPHFGCVKRIPMCGATSYPKMAKSRHFGATT
jgi:hypothetical protein